MALYLCKICGKLFERVGNGVYCKGPHYRGCEICGKLFEYHTPSDPRRCCSKKCIDILADRSKQSKQIPCKECGKLFTPRQASQVYCKGPHTSTCVVCGKEFTYTCRPTEKPKTCSRDCQTKLQSNTVQNNTGYSNPSLIPEVREKISAANRSDGKGGQKRLATNQTKYGVDNVAKLQSSIEKAKATFQANYGVDNPMKSSDIASKLSIILSDPEHVAKVKQTLLDRYGVTSTQEIPGVRDRTIATNMKRYGVPYYCMTAEFKRQNGHTISKTNIHISQLLTDANISHTMEFIVETRSFDFKLTDSNTVLEIDPTYTHNLIGNHWGSGIPASYHKDKSLLAQKHGYRCIHIFDWDDVAKIISLLKPKTTIYGRSCDVRHVTTSDAVEFTTKYHLQGSCKGQVLNYGLYYNDELVEIMTFGTPRYNRHYDLELLRLCSRSDLRVAGGASRLFSRFKQENTDKSVISYCDLAKFSGDVYNQLGMTLKTITEPNKIWSKNADYVTQNLLNQRGFDQLFNTDFGKGTSNEQLMIEHGWLPVADCGQAVYIL